MMKKQTTPQKVKDQPSPETPEEVETSSIPPEKVEPETQFQALQDELAEAQAKASEYLDGWQRSRAEFANYKKRIDRDLDMAHQNAVGNIVKHYLDIADDLERALKNRPSEGDGAAWADGVELIYRKLLTILENEGIQPLGKAGDTFDPTLHEAILAEASDQFESGKIIEVLKPGYVLGDRVLRPAAVRVAQ